MDHLIKQRLVINLKLNEYQFEYKKNSSTKDSCLALDHYCVRKHLDIPKSYVRVLFVDSFSMYNTILSYILANLVAELGSPDYLVTVIMSLLTGRKRLVKIGDTDNTSVLTSYTDAPQGCFTSFSFFCVYL